MHINPMLTAQVPKKICRHVFKKIKNLGKVNLYDDSSH